MGWAGNESLSEGVMQPVVDNIRVRAKVKDKILSGWDTVWLRVKSHKDMQKLSVKRLIVLWLLFLDDEQ